MTKNVYCFENETEYEKFCEQLSDVFTALYRQYNEFIEDGNENAAAVVENVINMANDDIGRTYGLGIVDVWDYLETVEIGPLACTEIIFRS